MLGLFTKPKRREPRCLIPPRTAAKSVVLTGETGAGKSTVLFQLIDEWAHAEDRVNFAFTTVKPSDCADYERILRRAGRDPLVITGDGSFRISPFVHEMSRPGGGPRNLAALHQDLLEVLSRSDSSRTETFWKSITEETLFYAFELCHMVGGVHQAGYSDIAGVIMSIPQDREQAADDSFARSTVCGRYLDQAYGIDERRANVIADHFLNRLPSVGERARGAAVTGAMQSLQPFLTDPLASIVNGPPTHTVAELLNRDTIFALDTNTHGKNGLAMQLMLCWLLQEEVLRRTGEFDYFCLVRDECGHTAHAARDIRNSSVGRQQKYISCMAFQGLNSLISQLGGGLEASIDAKALYGLSVNKIMCRQSSCPDTAELNATTIGHERQMFYSGGGAQPQQQEHQWWDVLGVGNTPSIGFNENFHFKIPPAVFQDLKAGGIEDDYEVEAILFDGTNHYRHSFFQR